MKDAVLASVSLVTCLAFRALADQSPVGDHHGRSGDLLSRSFGHRAAINVTLNQIFGHTFDYNLQEQTMLSRHTATEYQRRIAEQNAKAFFKQLPPAKKQELKEKKIKVVLIRTVRSRQTSPEAREVRMRIDLEAGSLIDDSAYEFTTPLPADKIVKVKGLEPEYVGP
jgi:hypothetical protein